MKITITILSLCSLVAAGFAGVGASQSDAGDHRGQDSVPVSRIIELHWTHPSDGTLAVDVVTPSGAVYPFRSVDRAALHGSDDVQ